MPTSATTSAKVPELKAAFPGFVLLGSRSRLPAGRPHSEVRSLLQSQPFDYVIGSVHHPAATRGSMIPGRWRDTAPAHRRRWVDYFELVGEAANPGLFTILGHLDLVKSSATGRRESLDTELDRLIERIARAGVAIEKTPRAAQTGKGSLPVARDPREVAGCRCPQLPRIRRSSARRKWTGLRPRDRPRPDCRYQAVRHPRARPGGRTSARPANSFPGTGGRPSGCA